MEASEAKSDRGGLLSPRHCLQTIFRPTGQAAIVKCNQNTTTIFFGWPSALVFTVLAPEVVAQDSPGLKLSIFIGCVYTDVARACVYSVNSRPDLAGRLPAVISPLASGCGRDR